MVSTPKMLTIAAISTFLHLAAPVQLAAQEAATKAFSIRSAPQSTLKLSAWEQEILTRLWFKDILSEKTLSIYFELFIDPELRFLLEDLQKTYFSVDAKKELPLETQTWIEEILWNFFSNVSSFLQETDPVKKLHILEEIFNAKDAILLLSMVESPSEEKMFFREKKTGPVFKKLGAEQTEKLEAIFDGAWGEEVQKTFQKALAKKWEKYLLEQIEKVFGALTYYPKWVPQELYKKERVEVASVEKPKRRAENRGHREPRRTKKETNIASNGSFSLFWLFGLTGN